MEGKIPDAEKQKIEAILGQLKEAHKTENLEAIDKYTAELQQLFAQATQNAQNQTGAPNANFTNPTNNESQTDENKNKDNDISDIDYEEVN